MNTDSTNVEEYYFKKEILLNGVENQFIGLFVWLE